jgi:TonB family protein
MKNLYPLSLAVVLLLFGGLACKNPLAKYTKQYNCSIPGEAEPQTSDQYVTRAFKHLEANNYANNFDQCAFDAAAEALRLDAQNADALAFRGREFYLRGLEEYSRKNEGAARTDLESALADLDAAIRIKPAQYQFYYSRALVYEKIWFLGDTRQRVLDDVTKTIELCKDDCHASFHQKRGELNLELGNWQVAVEDFTNALEKDPSERLYYEKRAEAYRQLGKNELAEKDEAAFPAAPPTNDSDTKYTVENKSSNSNSSDSVMDAYKIINAKATNLAKPTYPPAAKAVRASGAVNVQVTLDEQGNVTAANAVSGHPLLRASAVQAARASKFNPTIESGKPVKIKGVIVFNFTPE